MYPLHPHANPRAEEELLPAKDVKALFISEEQKKLTRKEVYIKNGEKVSDRGAE